MGKGRKLFLTDYTLTPLEKIPGGGILCEKERIIAIGGQSAFALNDEGLELFDFTDCYAMPGFIDSHIHGIGPYDLNAPEDMDVLENVSMNLVCHGVTAFCPTIVSRPKEELLKTVDMLARMIGKGVHGAGVAGIHLEGPFLNKAKRGSQDADAILEEIDFGFVRELIQAGNSRIKLMTFAPELKDSDKLAKLLMDYGVIPSMGHSMATEKQALRCIDAGVERCTYVFNGMPQLYHRESSLTDVALCDDRVSVEMICDGVHIHPRFVDLTVRCKPRGKIIGISNAVASATDENVVTTSSGLISGATMTLDGSWKHLMTYAGMDQSLAAMCFSMNPADNLGLLSRGELRPGKLADIVFFDSTTNQVRAAVVRGQIIYRAGQA